MKLKKILVVDDEPINFDVVEGLLMMEGYQLSYASNGLKALKRLDSEQPDLILLDVMMPEMNGIEVCSRVKSNPNLSHIPIVMVTALNSKEDMAHCLDAGADDFTSKPVVGIELRARVRSMLRIKEQHDALKATLQLREDLSHAIVHDLKNPLATMILAADVLQHTQLQESQLKKVQLIKNGAYKLRSLTDDLLSMAKAEAGKFELQLTPVDLCVLATDVVADFRVIAENQSIELVLKLPTFKKELFFDVKLLRRVLENLLANAIKFSPKKSQVTLEIIYLQEDGKVQIQISDRGRGVTQELRKSIFQKFEVGKVLDNIPQTGIGLAFCKMVVDAHKGEIFVTDNSPHGAIFTLQF
jgi:signal transduction histidine kinase